MSINSQDDWWSLYERQLPNIRTIFQRVGVDHLTLDICLMTRDWQQATMLLQRCWSQAPDDPIIHTWKGWFSLCDLCSESWVFYEMDDDEDVADAQRG